MSLQAHRSLERCANRLVAPSQNPILTGREPDASDAQRALSAERSAELSEKVNQVRCPQTPQHDCRTSECSLYTGSETSCAATTFFFQSAADCELTGSSTSYLQFILRRTNALLSKHLPPKVGLSPSLYRACAPPWPLLKKFDSLENVEPYVDLAGP
jgi:hypothetical protein